MQDAQAKHPPLSIMPRKMISSSDSLHDTPIYVGIDVGGTFTDFVVWQDGRLRIHKVPTTPDDQSRAILQGLHDLNLLTPSPSRGLVIVHGMTVATNALLERRGAVTALLTTAGFADALVIGRQNRPHLYRLHQQRPPLLAPDGLRFEVDERLDAEGSVLRPLDEGQLAAVAHHLRRSGAESVAVVFLFSYRNPEHEQRAAELLQGLLPELPFSLSSEVLPEYREYERTATTLINAYVQPLVARYLARLEQASSISAKLRHTRHAWFSAARPAAPWARLRSPVLTKELARLIFSPLTWAAPARTCACAPGAFPPPARA
jgi:N-methylhydantoinase A